MNMREKKRVLLAALVSFVSVYGAFAQTISGTVKDLHTGEPIIGATIRVGNARGVGVVTDAEGNFSIKVNKLPVSLVTSFAGYQKQNVVVYDDEEQVSISLKESALALNEVVIAVPYGQVKKDNFTGSAAYISGEQIAQAQVSNVSKALEGTAPGLQSFSSAGQPGSGANILIRGVSSANYSNEPLFVVDGVPYGGSLNTLSSQDIENITVLKDAASTSLYGSRAANGVIMITTKKGHLNEKAKVDLTAKYGWSRRAISDYKQVNTQQWLELFWESLRNYRQDQGFSADEAATWASDNFVSRLGINPYGTNFPNPIGVDGKLVDGASLLWDYDWDDALQQNAHYQDYTLRVSGGTANTRYFFSAGYLDDQGAYKASDFSRYTLRANIDTQIKPWLEAGVNLGMSYTVTNEPPQTSVQLLSPIFYARNMRGWMPIYQHDLTTGELLLDDYGNPQYDYGLYRLNNYNGYNLVSSLDHDRWRDKRETGSIRSFINVKPLKGLSYKFSINIDYSNTNSLTYRNPAVGKYAASGGSVSHNNSRSTRVTLNNIVSYVTTFDDVHNINVMAGQEYYETNSHGLSGSRTGILTDGYYELSMASTISGSSSSSSAYKLFSLIGSANYNYAEKYYVSGSVRYDGSSHFHPSQRWGTFWSLGASWKLSKEQFLSDVKWIDNLSIRTSYGGQGNDNGGSTYQALFAISNNLGKSGLRASTLSSEDVHWETNLNLNVGVDFGFFNNRLQGSVEYFVRRSKDLLFERELVPSSGFTSTIQNIGALKNYGWEFSLSGYPIDTKDWKWKIGANLTSYKNKITSLPEDEMWSGNRKWVIGGSLYDLYVVEWAGVNPENGNGQWWYTNAEGERVKTESYSQADTDENKVYVGKSLPTVSGGVNTELTWKDLSLSALVSFSLGGHIINNDYSHIMQQGGHWYAWSVDILDRWTPENRNTDVAKMTYSPQKVYNKVDSHFLQSNSYARLKTLTLSYNVPRRFIRHTGLQRVNVFVQGENLLTLCGQQGLDPEQSYDGTSNFRYPAMKTFSLGLNVQF